MKLTEKEFDTIIEALEHLPNKNGANRILAKLTATMLIKGNEEDKDKIEAEIENMEAKELAEMKDTKKMCSIITGKLYMMKDEIIEQPS